MKKHLKTLLAAAAACVLSLSACEPAPAGIPSADLIRGAGDFAATGTPGVSYLSYSPSTDVNLDVSIAFPPESMLQYFFISNTSPSADFVVSSLSADATSGAVRSDAAPAAPRSPRAIRGLPGKDALMARLFSRDRARSRALDGSLPPPRLAIGGGDQSLFILTDSDTNSFSQKPSKCVSTQTRDGRTLYVYVATEDWDAAADGGNGANVTPAMASALSDRFLGPDANDDIFNWISGVYGAEWGDIVSAPSVPHYDPSAIEFTGEIYIMLGDIDADQEPNGGIVGYYYAANNYAYDPVGNPDSNGRIMFFLDSYMYANADDDGDPATAGDGGSWASTDYWPEECFATLAHEFQHMIHYYQKTVLNDATGWSETWLDEMCSAMAEDFVADKLGIKGPRGWEDVNTIPGLFPPSSDGRLPLFVYWPEYSLTKWDGSLNNYSQVYAFGAWLARNYGGPGGGPALFAEIAQNGGLGFDAVTDAITALDGVAETARSLFTKWGVSCLASAVPGYDMAAPYCYDTGSVLVSGSYSLGPIRLSRYRYYSSPTVYGDNLYVYGSVPDGETNPAMSNIYFSLPVLMATNTAVGSLTLRAGQTLTAVSFE